MDQAIWFSLAAICALAISVVFGALSIKAITKNLRVDTKLDDIDGLDGLVHRSYFFNLPISVRNFRLEARKFWRDGVRSADRWSLIKIIFGSSDQ